MSTALLWIVLAAASPSAAAVSDVRIDLWLPAEPALHVEAEQVLASGAPESSLRVARLRHPRVRFGDALGLAAEDGVVDLEAGTVRADGAVEATLATGEPVEVRSEHFALDVEHGTGVFTGAVVATHGSLVVTCERVEVTFDADRRAIRTVVATGGVEIRQGDRIGRGDRAEFAVEPGTVLLEGSPSLQQGAVLLRGTTIRFDVAGGDISCTGCQAVFGEER